MRFGDTRISVSDVDGLFVVERSACFLFIETKKPEEPLGIGQRILLEQLSGIPRATVIVLRGESGYPVQMQKIKHGKFGTLEKTDREDFQRRLNIWFSYANSL